MGILNLDIESGIASKPSQLSKYSATSLNKSKIEISTTPLYLKGKYIKQNIFGDKKKSMIYSEYPRLFEILAFIRSAYWYQLWFETHLNFTFLETSLFETNQKQSITINDEGNTIINLADDDEFDYKMVPRMDIRKTIYNFKTDHSSERTSLPALRTPSKAILSK